MSDPWQAGDWFVSPDVDHRRLGLAVLASDEFVFSPLSIYLLASRLDEPDLELRRRMIVALARCYDSEGTGPAAPRSARESLSALLAAFDRPQVERLLEAAGDSANGEDGAELQAAVTALLDRIPNLAGMLTRIVADRSAALPTRARAVAALGELGVIEALPALEGLRTRIEGQAAGQLAMAFAPASHPDNEKLLDLLKSAIGALHEAG